jgi:hypothetical protein
MKFSSEMITTGRTLGALAASNSVTVTVKIARRLAGAIKLPFRKLNSNLYEQSSAAMLFGAYASAQKVK